MRLALMAQMSGGCGYSPQPCRGVHSRFRSPAEDVRDAHGPRYPNLLPGLGGIRIDSRLNVRALREITDDSGGRTEIVRDARDLNPATASIADELSRQYYLGYASPGHRDGRWHTLRVEARDDSLRVRARRGYIAAS